MEMRHNIAIVGCGIIAQTHLGVLKKLENAKVVALCDTDEKKAEATARTWKIPHYYGDFSKMLANENISIVSILTPPSSHARLAIEAAVRGMNVVVEKPLTMTTTEAERIVGAFKDCKGKISVVYHWLFSKAMSLTLSLVKQDVAGEILGAEIAALNEWQHDPMTSDPNHWSHKLPGGRFGEMLPHPIYVLQSILGDSLNVKDVIVSKRGKIPWMPKDELQVILNGEKGHGSLYVSFNSPRHVMNLNVYGTKEIYRVDLMRQIVSRMKATTADKFSMGRDVLAEALNLSTFALRNAFEFGLRKPGEYAISNFYNSFIESIRMGSEHIITPEMAFNTVRIVEEICSRIDRRD